MARMLARAAAMALFVIGASACFGNIDTNTVPSTTAALSAIVEASTNYPMSMYLAENEPKESTYNYGCYTMASDYTLTFLSSDGKETFQLSPTSSEYVSGSFRITYTVPTIYMLGTYSSNQQMTLTVASISTDFIAFEGCAGGNGFRYFVFVKNSVNTANLNYRECIESYSYTYNLNRFNFVPKGICTTE